MDAYDAKKKHSKTVKKDPRVTLSDSLIIDVDGILDNDDEVSLETPVTIPENTEPSEFGRAVTDALVPSTKVSSESERSVAVRFSSVKDGANSDSAKGSNIQEKKPPPVIKSKLKSTTKPYVGKERPTSEVNSDNLSDSTTVSTSNKTSGGSRTSSRASQKVLGDAKVPKRRAARLNGRVEARIGKAKLPNGSNDVTDALANGSLEEEKRDVREGRPPILAPWDEKSKKETKPNSPKNKPRQIDIDELQKDMGKI